MKISDFVCTEAIVPELSSVDRDEVILELVEALRKAKKIKKSESEEIYKAIIKRENEASTGIGKGVAVPHVKHSCVKNVIAAIGRTSRGIDFSSLDKQPVYSVFLLISPPDKPDKHLEAMENLFKCLQNDDFRRFLKQAETAENIKDLICEADESFAV